MYSCICLPATVVRSGGIVSSIDWVAGQRVCNSRGYFCRYDQGYYVIHVLYTPNMDNIEYTTVEGNLNVDPDNVVSGWNREDHIVLEISRHDCNQGFLELLNTDKSTYICV